MFFEAQSPEYRGCRQRQIQDGLRRPSVIWDSGGGLVSRVFIRLYQPGFAEELFPGVILVYIFNGDRDSVGSGTGTVSRRKNFREKLFCDVQ